MSQIHKIHAREVLDSRGRPTVEVEITTDNLITGRAIVPSGASTGMSEAWELRDREDVWYDGNSVKTAVQNVNTKIKDALAAFSIYDQQMIDQVLIELDGTDNKQNLGANAILGTSLAVAHAAANDSQVPLYQYIQQLNRQFAESSAPITPADIPQPGSPKFALSSTECKIPMPMVNMISGGLHAGGKIEFQDFLIIPIGAPNYTIGLEWIVRVYNRLKKLLDDAGYESALVGDEGGFGPKLESTEQAAQFVTQAIEAANLRPKEDVVIALDVAASHFYQDGKYHLTQTRGKIFSASEMIDLLENLVDQYPIVSIEDGLAEEDWEGWQELVTRLGEKVWLVGDDLLTTNAERLQKAIRLKAANSVLVKVNQIGTLTETLQTIHLARQNNLAAVISARSGETEDTTIVDLAIGTSAGQLKVGSIVRSERLAKYNHLLRLTEDLQTDYKIYR